MRKLNLPPKNEDIIKPSPSTAAWFYTVWEKMNLYEGAADPTLVDIPDKQWIYHYNTTLNQASIWVRRDGTLIQQVLGGAVSGTGTVTNVSVATANGFAGVTATPSTTPVISIKTTVSGILKGNGTAVSAAVSGTDYETPGAAALAIATHNAAADPHTQYVLETTTVNGHPLNANVTVTASDVGLGSVTNDVQTKAAIVPNTAPSAGQLLVGNAGGTAYAPVSSSGDVTVSSTGVFTIGANKVTFAKFVAATAASVLVGRGSAAGAGNFQEITLGTGLSMTGTVLSATGGGTGDVTGPASSVNNNVVFFNGTTGKVIKDSGLTLSGTNTGDQTITLTGDVTGSGTGSFAATIANGAVTLVKMANIANNTILGNQSGAAGAPIALTTTQVKGFLTYTASDVGLGNVTNDTQTKAAIVPNTVPAAGDVLQGNAGGTAYSNVTMGVALNSISNVQGSVLFRNNTNWTSLAPGTAGQVLQTNGSAANPSWVGTKRQLANVTLGSAGLSLASGTIAACKFLEIHIYISGYAGSDTASLQFNGAAGTAYRYRWLTSASGGTTFAAGLVAASTDRIKVAAVNTTNSRRVVCWISNDSAVTEKLVKFESQFGTTSAGTQDTIDLGQGAWVSGASTQITSVSLVSTSNMNAGTQMTIYGWN